MSSDYNPHTSRMIFTSNPALIANLFQCFEEKVEVNFSIFIWFMSVWYLSHLNVAWETGDMGERRVGRGEKEAQKRGEG